MSKPWEAIYQISEEEATVVIEKQFSELSPVSIKVLGKGFDNTVYQVNEEFVFRFPRREIALKLLRKENNLLPSIASKINIPIPNPLFLGQPSKTYPCLFSGYRMIEGMTPMSLTREQRLEFVKPFAQFLTTLHSFPIDRAEKLGIPFDEMNRLSMKVRKPIMEDNIQKLKGLGYDPIIEKAENYLHSVEVIPVPDEKVLVHDDLHIRNILVDEEGKIAGIIDWGDAHIGHRASDLSILYSLIPKEGRKPFYDIYGEVDSQTKQLAKFKAIFVHILLLLYAHDVGDEALIIATRECLSLGLED